MEQAKPYFQQDTGAAPLAVFRIFFGLLLFAGVIRFWAKGWIHELYIEPQYFFPFYGFEFITAPGAYVYVLFAICGLAALCVAIGLYYRVSSVVLFLSFTYIELIDKSTYLNHYYFASMVCLLLIMLPAHTFLSVDSVRKKSIRQAFIPRWSTDALKIFVCIIYVYAGLAKVNSDWLLEAQPLRIWLPAKNDLPLVGPLFNHVWVAYAFSWAGCLYDLTIPFLLLNSRTRVAAYGAVVIFHGLTAVLFPIGMFPYMMIVTALIFFPAASFHRVISWFTPAGRVTMALTRRAVSAPSGILMAALGLFFLAQLLVPLRYMAYPGELFWTEEGYRFSWRVMLVEKAGYAEFTVRERNGAGIVVDNSEFLTPLQEKMMAVQPDMILQYAHILAAHFRQKGFQDPEVYVDSYVSLNGRLGQPLVNPLTNLAQETESFESKKWILTLNDEIKGL